MSVNSGHKATKIIGHRSNCNTPGISLNLYLIKYNIKADDKKFSLIWQHFWHVKRLAGM